jgi:hypothetical protein
MTKRIIVRFLQLAAVSTAACFIVYISIQQVWRHDANDPQVQLARDAAARLASGEAPAAIVSSLPPLDFAHSLAPFLTVFDARGAIVATSGRIRGEARTLPAGVLDHVRQSGEERVTWQPAPDARLATVIVAYPEGFVLAGRSLAESESRTAQMRQLIGLMWLGTLAIIGALTTVTENLLPR